ncbi:ribosome-recycling factor, mitochondrial-like [Stylophora pistillata]|uniref:Ribosome-recycling factor, mitochondrial n=1 Tax=Stylophora pistillata TaxID=50429 RepID=A0A2B4SYH8_STYPI|nr:ribosome-recycling factor, mitochondrial-like [Stylophora pistillata]PFX34961.1 Ribosome-recycling factor, mitochondrial [Stylophora pistillata]
MSCSIASRFSALLGVYATRTTYARLSSVRFYAAKKGKKARSAAVSIDHDIADGLVDLEKLKSNMASTVTRLQLEFRDKITVEIKPDILHQVKVESANGKEKFVLGDIAQIKLSKSMFVVDLSRSPELVPQAAEAIKTWNTDFEPIMSGHVISVSIPKVTQEYRENLVKMAKSTSEQYKQSIRKIRQKGMTDIRKNKKGKSEDDARMVEKMIQQLTDQFCGDTDLLLEEKTNELLRK